MEPVLYVVLAWVLFTATHIGLTIEPVRGPIVARFGRVGFTAAFSVVAAVTLAVGIAAAGGSIHVILEFCLRFRIQRQALVFGGVLAK